MIILVGSEKGGTGKSTLATNLAAIHASKKNDVILFDADKQGTSALWSSTRDENEHQPRVSCVQKHGNKVHVEIMSLAEKYKTVIIDAGGRDSVELRSAMIAADRFIMPIRASQFDAWTIERAEDLVQKAKTINDSLKCFIVINQASPNPVVNEATEMRSFLKEFEEFKLAKSIIRDRISFRKAAREGLTVNEFKPIDKKAVTEINNLYKEIFKK